MQLQGLEIIIALLRAMFLSYTKLNPEDKAINSQGFFFKIFLDCMFKNNLTTEQDTTNQIASRIKDSPERPRGDKMAGKMCNSRHRVDQVHIGIYIAAGGGI